MTAPASDWQIVTPGRDKLGESVLWHPTERALYWIDFYGPTVHRRDPATGQQRDWIIAGHDSIGSLVFCADGRLLVALEDGVHHFDRNTGELQLFGDPNQGRAAIAYNDAKVDRQGRYWVGTLDAKEKLPRGIFYSTRSGRDWRLGDSGFVVSNGPTFSPSGDRLYFSDSMGGRILAYALDPATGRLGEAAEFHRFAPEDGFPDGLTADSEGNIWCALYGGGKVLRLDPGGTRLEEIALPVPDVTSCCLGGPGLKTLYVTTGHTSDKPPTDLGGALFAREVAIAGLPEPLFKPEER
ncbi:MAG TPA: SMP-30/gluconolactonase/LRE family protein [Hypericibacter adhaerens]|uniref:SMP-30/gluconolactonase/LRE family protein n=1 Tax=Hypericibacter adhaerens TaxID=2602016 RepID=UPI002C7CDE5F|nr:SMP-30/gluconolactonase/LRE family protein [Hypericibacter adhaerens]HWA44713.1 SMP-30/gluconolactonase/LRE family protein [Hypericibacter adhaerens]